MCILETKIEIINGISSVPVTTQSRLDLGLVMDAPGRVSAIKFLNEHVVLALWQYEGGAAGPQLVAVRVRHLAEEGSATRVELGEDLSSFGPVHMEILGADDSRGGVPARVCLLGKDEVSYKVFALPDGIGASTRPRGDVDEA